jgi:hypothetical protein
MPREEQRTRKTQQSTAKRERGRERRCRWLLAIIAEEQIILRRTVLTRTTKRKTTTRRRRKIFEELNYSMN